MRESKESIPMTRWVWRASLLLTIGCEGLQGSHPSTRAESSSAALASGEKCPAISYVTLSVSVADQATGSALCDAEVEVIDEQGRKLAMQRGGDGCTLVAYDGHEGRFEVRARKAGYNAATKQTSMRKLPCQFSAPAVQLALKAVQ